MTEQPIVQQVVDAIVQWARSLERPQGQSRVNRKLLFGDPVTAARVADALHGASDERCAYVVRCSTDADAVKLRNARPAGVPPRAAIIYLVFWLPGHPNHERSFESLRDFPSVSLDDLLSCSDSFLLEPERDIAGRCAEAAEAWPARDCPRAAEHLRAAWTALRTCLREKRGADDRALPFIESLGAYLEFLAHAQLPAARWTALPAAERAAALVAQWGVALPRLGMFTLPALASVIGIQTNPSSPISTGKTSGQGKWTSALEEVLAENKEAATDFAGLEEAIAGKQTLRERLDDLTAKIPLCQEPTERSAARTALERFCQSGDESALTAVEWAFRENPSARRSSLQGLKGLLIARKLRAPREHPADRAARETIDAIEALAGDDARESGIVRQYVEERRAQLASNERAGAPMADVLRSLAAGALPAALASAPMQTVCERVLSAPERSPAVFERLARAWEKLERADADAPVAAESLLRGLVHLSYARMRERDPDGDLYRLVGSDDGDVALMLTVAVEGERTSLRVPVNDWGEKVREELRRWLLDKVRPLHVDEEEPPDAADEDMEAEPAITIDIELVRGRGTSPFGVIEIPIPGRRAVLVERARSPALVSTRIEGAPATGRLLAELYESSAATAIAEDPRDDALSAAWADYVRALGDRPGWAMISCIAPPARSAAGWVEAWARCIAGVGVHANLDDELRLLDQRFDLEEDPIELKRIDRQRKELRVRQQAGPAVDQRTVRSLLRLGTGRSESHGRTRQVVLTPHHPLVLRLRLVEDQILAKALRQLWTAGWDRRTLDDLDGALEDWGLPEPIHCYGFWDGEPLVFDTWLEDGFALFSALGSERDADAAGLGIRPVARELERYAALFPAAADRLRLRFQGDAAGRWAWGVVAKRLESSTFAADLELVTSLPRRQPSALDLGIRADDVLGRAFEPGIDGSLPRIRAARRRPSDEQRSDVHVSAVLGDLLAPFRSTIAPVAAGPVPVGYDALDDRVFFHEAVPDLLDYAFLVGDAPDTLSRAAAKAIGVAAGHPQQVFRERYSFDPTTCSHPLRELQVNAHWLVLASRQPLYRAVQQCGTATLLDFYSATERGRAVHVCVSLDVRSARDDVARLRRMLDALSGTELTANQADGFLAAARSLAPGLAIRCIGSTGGIDLSGLVGLLLSARATKGDAAGGLLLALDQHRDLLTGRGQLSDLLRLRLHDQRISIDVIEAKFSTGELTPTSAAVVEARQQIRSTVERLAQFALHHPLILRTRARLARAIVQRLHLGAPEVARASEWRALIDAVLDPTIDIVIGGSESGAIHAWSVAAETRADVRTAAAGETLHIHDRDETIALLSSL